MYNDQQLQIKGEAGLQQQQQRPGKVQLSEFWPQAPNAWFAAAELKFEVANINSKRELFAHSVGAMGFNILRAVMDLVENPLAVNPYTMLKGRLVLAHQLTPIQKATKCLQVVASNNQQPSDVLASLLEYCLPREESTAFSRAAFTMRLPVVIQAHLTGAELIDLKDLAQLAERLWQCHGPQTVALWLERSTSLRMTAVMSWPPYRPGNGPSRSMGAGRGPVASPARANTSATSTPSLVRTLSTVRTRRTAPGRETR